MLNITNGFKRTLVEYVKETTYEDQNATVRWLKDVAFAMNNKWLAFYELFTLLPSSPDNSEYVYYVSQAAGIEYMGAFDNAKRVFTPNWIRGIKGDKMQSKAELKAQYGHSIQYVYIAYQLIDYDPSVQ